MTKSKQNVKVPKAPKPVQAKKKDKSKRKQPRSGLSQLECMVLDPCHCELATVYSNEMGGGVVQRVKMRLSLHDVALDNSGMLIWYPAYHNVGTNGAQLYGGTATANAGGGSLYVFESSNPSLSPINSVALPMGNGASVNSVTGRFIRDPAGQFMDNNNVAGARLISCCIRLIYRGPAQSCAGEFAFIRNLPASDWMASNGTVSNTEQLFAYASSTSRFVDGLEFVYSPNDDSEIERSVGVQGNLALGTGVQDASMDAAFEMGVPAASATKLGGLQNSATARGFGIVWAGLNGSQTDDLVIELVKVFQYHLRPNVGMMEQSISSHSPVNTTVNQTPSKAVAELSRKVGHGWDLRSSLTAIEHMGSKIQDIVLRGEKAAAAVVKTATVVAPYLGLL